MAFINDNEVWDWQAEDCYFVDNANLIGSNSQNESIQSEIIYAGEGEKTPAKGMLEHAYFVENTENKNKRQNQWSESCSQAKRRRVLQFDSEVIDGSVCTDEANTSALTTSNGAEDSSVNEVLSQMSSWLCEDADGSSLPCNEVLDQTFERWLSSCLTDADMEFNPDQSSGIPNMENDGGMQNLQHGRESIHNMANDGGMPILQHGRESIHNMANDGGMQMLQHRRESTTMPVRQRRESTRMPVRQGRESIAMPERPIRIHHNSKFEGKKSFTRTSDMSSTSIVCPFSFLKPCSFSGDLTLKDINRRIHAPPKSEKDPISYSAFSGKPVVAKTKICTEGGRGSITIMRTKG